MAFNELESKLKLRKKKITKIVRGHCDYEKMVNTHYYQR